MAGATNPYSAMVLGATGNVGSRIVQLLIESPRCRRIVLVNRRLTNAFPHPKVTELVVNMDHMEAELALHVHDIDLAIAAFGIGKGSARMPEAEVRKIEIAYPQSFCRAAKAAGARVCSMMTAIGANPNSRFAYTRIIGEKEQAIQAVQFDYLALFRPAVILGNTNTGNLIGTVIPLIHWAFPSKYHSIHKDDLAQAMVGQSEVALGGETPRGTVRILEYSDMKPFFAEGRGANLKVN